MLDTSDLVDESSEHPGAAMAKGLRTAQAARDGLVRRLVLDGGAIEILATEVLGYELQPFHRRQLHFQSANRKSLQLGPRGFGKSTVLDITRCIFEVVRNPNVRVLIVSNTQLQAEVFLREIKQQFELNAKLTRIFGNFVGEAKWDTRELVVRPRTSWAKESTISCVGVGGPIVSRHYDVIIADDLIDEENSRTEGQRQKVRDWFYRSLMPTLEPHGRIHLLGTRYHFDDLYGQLIAGEYADCHQVVKAIADDGSTPWPEKFSLEWLERTRRSMGTMLFNGQYQNDVEAMKGRLFKAEWLKYFDQVPPGLAIYQGVDLAISKKETADYFALVTVGIDEHRNVYVLDALQRRLTFQQQTAVIVEKFEAYQPIMTAVESNAYQAAQVEELQTKTNVPVKPITTTKDKVTRYLRLSARFELGTVFLPRAGVDELLNQLLLAPEAAHDDLLDALDFAMTTALDHGRRELGPLAPMRSLIRDSVEDWAGQYPGMTLGGRDRLLKRGGQDGGRGDGLDDERDRGTVRVWRSRNYDS